jgi:serine/threonine protein kinase
VVADRRIEGGRYGRDLLDIVDFLDGQGVWHRDIKPANLAARPRPKDKQLHLCAFDFSLAAAPAAQLGAGTPTYLGFHPAHHPQRGALTTPGRWTGAASGRRG